VRKLRRLGGLGRGGSSGAPSLLPLIVFSALITLLLSQSSVILAYPLFQSPVQSPAPTAAPPEGEPVPPEGEPVPPEGESVPPEGEPVPPEGPPEALPTETVGAETTPSTAPEGTPVEGATTEPLLDEEESSSTGGVSSAVLIDTCVVGLSTVWLCCGGLALVIFILLVIASFLLRVT
jgi:hypothetical protein